MRFASLLLATVPTLAFAACSAGDPSPSASPSVCPADSYQCASGACIATSAVCDGVDDCGDGSDEQGCGDANTGGSAAGGTGGGVAPTGGTGGGVTPAGGSGGEVTTTGGSGGGVTGGSAGTTTGGTAGSLTGGAGGGVTGGGGGTTSGGAGGSVTGGSGGDSPVGGSGGDIGTGGTGGDATTGGSGGDPVTGGTGGSEPGAWYGLTNATAISTLQSEYDSWKAAYFHDCGDGSACIVKDGSSCVSEGIGYGMLLAVNMDDRDAFDKLWAYYVARMNTRGIMGWTSPICGSVDDPNGATDAELDAAMALIQADARWGGYTADATALITAVRDHETDVCNGMTILQPGDGWGDCPGNTTVNPSYFSPGYYRVFAAYVPEQAELWNQLLVDTYTLYAQYQSEMDGLICGWADLNGGCTSGFDWDGVRAPWRVATDYAWFGTSDAEQALLGISAYVDSHGGISGVSFEPNSAFRGSLALSGIATDQTKFDTYVSEWLSSVNAGAENMYFQATLRVLFLMLAAGQFPSTL
jgi:endo-1,4-beta-D-glucanase Y